MEQLLRLMRCHFDSQIDRLQVFHEEAVQCEGWFKGELLMFLHKVMGSNIQSFKRESRYNSHNKRRIDFIITIDEQTHYVELKHWHIGEQKPNTWHAVGYFGDKSNGIYNDVEKLSKIKNDNRWILVFATKNPGVDDWANGIERFNEKFRRFRVSSISDPSEFPDYYFCGLLKIH